LDKSILAGLRMVSFDLRKPFLSTETVYLINLNNINSVITLSERDDPKQDDDVLPLLVQT
jgi:hypothetical protein